MSVYSQVRIKAKTQGNKTTVVASTPTSDRYDDVVAPSWNLDRYKSNPVVVWGHDYNLVPVGKTTDLQMDGDNLVATIEWDDNASNPLGQTVARQFREGYLNAVSVGFSPGKSTPRRSLPKDHPAYAAKGMYFESNELLEISAVSIPANSEALAIRAKRYGLGIQKSTVNRATVGIPAPDGHHWMDYEGGPVLMAGDNTDHEGAFAEFEFEIVEEHDPDRLKPEYQEQAMPDDDDEEMGYGDDDEEMIGDDHDDDEMKPYHDDEEKEDEEEDEEMRHFEGMVRKALLRVIAGDEAVRHLLFEDSPPTTPTGDQSINSLFGFE